MVQQCSITGRHIRQRHVTVLSASETGNSRGVAERLLEALAPICAHTRIVDTFDYEFDDLAHEDVLLMVTSTQGEGEPPMEAEDLHDFVMGDEAPHLGTMSFAVLGLGDSAYGDGYNRMARRFDERYAQLGAHRLVEHGECDLDYEAAAQRWIGDVVATLRREQGFGSLHAEVRSTSADVDDRGSADRDAEPVDHDVACATLVGRDRLTSRFSTKQVFRVRLRMPGDSESSSAGVELWQPGDMVAVGYANTDATLDRLLHAATGRSGVKAYGPGVEVLRNRDVTAMTPSLAARYADVARNGDLERLMADEPSLRRYCRSHPPYALFEDFPGQMSVQDLPAIFTARARRLYSIANEPRSTEMVVDLTVTAVVHDYRGEAVPGACSGYLATVPIDTALSVSIVPNPRFRLPDDPRTDVIMIGLGSAVAPYRAFLQRRDSARALGRNWLILGNRNPREDYLYRQELEAYRDSGLVRRLDIAWSRFGWNPRHVQNVIAECGGELWEWIDAGADVYVCGHGGSTIASIRDSLVEVVRRHGGLDRQDAQDYVSRLERAGRLRH